MASLPLPSLFILDHVRHLIRDLFNDEVTSFVGTAWHGMVISRVLCLWHDSYPFQFQTRCTGPDTNKCYNSASQAKTRPPRLLITDLRLALHILAHRSSRRFSTRWDPDPARFHKSSKDCLTTTPFDPPAALPVAPLLNNR